MLGLEQGSFHHCIHIRLAFGDYGDYGDCDGIDDDAPRFALHRHGDDENVANDGNACDDCDALHIDLKQNTTLNLQSFPIIYERNIINCQPK